LNGRRAAAVAVALAVAVESAFDGDATATAAVSMKAALTPTLTRIVPGIFLETTYTEFR
jgi:hypothetical protein